MQKKNQLFENLKLLKKEISDLRDKLNSIDEQKETWFDKKEEYGSKIRELIRSIKNDKAKRNELTKKVKEDKKERDKLNKEIKERISKIKGLKEQKESILKKERLEDPFRIKEAIERISQTIKDII